MPLTRVEPNILPLEYQPTLACDYFSRVEHLPWAMLLRSASKDHVDSRFDILVAEPVVTITTVGNESTVTTPDEKTHSSEDPFALIQALSEQYLPTIESDSELPFLGGSLGYFSYDLGRRVENMPELATKDLTTPDMAIGLYDWAMIVDHQQQAAYMVADNPRKKLQWLTEQHSPQSKTFALTSDWQANMSQQDYADKFAAIHDYLLSGDCYQINLAQRWKAQYQGSEWQAYQKLEQVNGAPFSAFIRLEESAILSISPERFIQLKQELIETKPIKGTRPRFESTEQDKQSANELASAEKDQAENLMIVDLLRNDIGRVAKPGSVHVPKLFDIESFPAVHHLVSTVRAELDAQYSPSELLRACFPGGSITGAPKVRAMEIIEELEPHRRSAYCGSIGYISRHGQMDTSITIRTLVAENGALHAWAGGGIVADSVCESEYQETFDKVSKILPVL
ncbi:aminodeoxychorismate synthase component 1 [Vibrio agarivorans]|uniref:aminodeoxychorismate synthase component 1 n=1 Tax=Vibrio agarivorans TaxID=153622 RepID=UPI0035E47DD1